MKKHVLPLIILFFCWTAISPAEDKSPRPAGWAQPINISAPENLYKVDDHLYRSGQPGKKGMKALERLGIRHVLNLREFHSDDDEAAGTNLKLHRVAMNAGLIKDEDIISALKVIKDADGPILVHCWHGSDRTGTVVAMYRIVFQNWSKAQALEELVSGGYGYHAVYANIPKYIEKVDPDHIRKVLGLHSDPSKGDP